MNRMIFVTVLLSLVLHTAPHANAQACNTYFVAAAAWHPDGHQFAAETCDGLVLYDAEGNVDSTLIAENIEDIAYQPNGNTLAFTADETLYLYDVSSGKMAAELPSSGAYAWSPDGSQIAVADSQQAIIHLYDARYKQTDRIPVRNGPVAHLAWTATPPAIVFIDLHDFDIYQWNIATKTLARFDQVQDVIYSWRTGNPWSQTPPSIFVALDEPGAPLARARISNERVLYTQTLDEVTLGFPDERSISIRADGRYAVVGVRGAAHVFNSQTMQLAMSYDTTRMGTLAQDCAPVGDESALLDNALWSPNGETLLVVNACRVVLLPVHLP